MSHFLSKRPKWEYIFKLSHLHNSIFSLKISNFWMATVTESSLNYVAISNLWWKRVTMHSVQNANSALGPLIQVFSPMLHIITMDFFCQNCLIIIDELLTNNLPVLKMWKNPLEHPTFSFFCLWPKLLSLHAFLSWMVKHGYVLVASASITEQSEMQLC